MVFKTFGKGGVIKNTLSRIFRRDWSFDDERLQ